MYADHAGRPGDLQVDDVQLAIQQIIQSEFTGPPSREMMAELATERNKEPLPIITEKFGVRLPGERFCLTQPNYKVIGVKTDDHSAPSSLRQPGFGNTLGSLPSLNQASAQRSRSASMDVDEYDV